MAMTELEKITINMDPVDLEQIDLEAVHAAGETLKIKVLGLASIADDVSPELACRSSPPWRFWAPSGQARPSKRR